MNNNVFTRNYLQNIPNENKRNEVNNMINQFIGELLRRAGQGQKSYFYDMTNMQFVRNNQICENIINNNQTYSVPTEEILSMFREKFPDCIVSYQEIWTEGVGGVRSVKRGILIDWF
jgi:hypothetical protein